MEKRLKSNKGFTLIELIVAVTILVLVVMPMAHVFWNAVNGNGKAKKKHSATVVAQNVMEKYKFTSMEDILGTLHNGVADSYTSEDTNGDGLNDKFVFEAFEKDASGNYKMSDGHYYISGSSGQKYFVTVTITPETYVSADDATQKLINSYENPIMTDLYNGNNVVITDELTKYDDYATVALGASKDSITKATTIEIVTDVSKVYPSTKYEYRTSVYVKCKYSAPGKSDYTTTRFVAAKSYFPSEGGAIPGVYLMYKNFNNTSPNSTDRLEIVHKYILNDSAPVSCCSEAVRVGIVNSTVEGAVSTSILDVDNVSTRQVYASSESGTEYNIPDGGVLALYSDIDGFGEGLTGGGSKENSLYGINVVVREKTYNGEIVANISSAKEANYGAKK